MLRHIFQDLLISALTAQKQGNLPHTLLLHFLHSTFHFLIPFISSYTPFYSYFPLHSVLLPFLIHSVLLLLSTYTPFYFSFPHKLRSTVPFLIHSVLLFLSSYTPFYFSFPNTLHSTFPFHIHSVLLFLSS